MHIILIVVLLSGMAAPAYSQSTLEQQRYDKIVNDFKLEITAINYTFRCGFITSSLDYQSLNFYLQNRSKLIHNEATTALGLPIYFNQVFDIIEKTQKEADRNFVKNGGVNGSICQVLNGNPKLVMEIRRLARVAAQAATLGR